MVPSSSPGSVLPTGVRQQLESLGMSDDLVVKVRDSHGFNVNAESALTTLATVASRQRVRTLLLGNPGLLCVPLGIWLEFLTAYGMSRHGFYSLLSTHPELFTTGSLFTAGSVIAYLQSLGLSPRDVVASIIPRCAQVLLLDVPSRLMPVVTFLVRELGMGQGQLAGLLARCPVVLLHDPATDLGPRLGALLAAGFEPNVARRAMCEHAILLVGDVSGALSRQKGFLVSECGFSEAQALQVLASCPAALSLTLPNLARKWRFLRDRMGCGREEVLAYPEFWSKNLLLEVGPRYAYVTQRLKLSGREEDGTAGVRGGGGAGPMPACPPLPNGSETGSRCSLKLDVLLDCNDAVFVSRVWQRGAASALFSAPGAIDDDSTGSGSGKCGSSVESRGPRAGEAAEGPAAGAAPTATAAVLAGGVGHGPHDGPYDVVVGCGVFHQGAERAAAAPEPATTSAAGAAAVMLTVASTSAAPGADVNTIPSPNVNPGPSIDLEADPGMGSTVEGDAGGLPAAVLGPYLADYRGFRAAWLEREGAKWTGVRSSTDSAAMGSW